MQPIFIFLHNKRHFCPNDSIHGYHLRSLVTFITSPCTAVKTQMHNGFETNAHATDIDPSSWIPHLSSHHLSTFLLRLSFSFINIMDSYGNIYPLTNPLVLITSCFAVVSSLYLIMRCVSSHSTPPLVAIRLDGSLLS